MSPSIHTANRKRDSHSSSLVSVAIFALNPNGSGSWCLSEALNLPVPAARLHLFSGTKILSSDEHERLYLWDISTPEVALQLRNVEAGEVSF